MGNAIIPRPSNWSIVNDENIFYKMCDDNCNDMLAIHVYDLKEYELSYNGLIKNYKATLTSQHQVDTIWTFTFEGELFNAQGIKYNLNFEEKIFLREDVFINYDKYVVTFSFGVHKEKEEDRINRFSHLYSVIFLTSIFPDSIISDN